jgi:hypothetical protein
VRSGGDKRKQYWFRDFKKFHKEKIIKDLIRWPGPLVVFFEFI